MANVKISALPAATSVASADVLPIVQSATTKKATIQNVSDALGVTTTVAGSSAGLVFISSSTFSGTTSFNNVFSSAYDNYRIVISDATFSGSATLAMRLRASGSDQGTSGSDYFTAYLGFYVTGVANNTTINGGSYWFFPTASTATITNFGLPSTMDIFSPYRSYRTHAHVIGHGYDGNYYFRNGMATYNATTACDGFTLYSTSANAISGKVQIFGYRQA